MNAYTIYAVNLGGDLISGCSDQAFDMGLVESIVKGDGSPYPTHIAPMEQRPSITFSTTELAALLTKIGVLGWTIDSPVILYCQKLSDTGRSAGSDHVVLTVNAGVVIPVQITASQGQGGEARMSARIVPTWDGTNIPIIPSTGALAGTPAVGSVYTVGPVKINGSWPGGVQSINVNFGITDQSMMADGEGWARNNFRIGMDPIIMIDTTEATSLYTLGMAGTAAASTTAVFFTRIKGSDQSMRYAANESQHVSIAAQGRVSVRTIGQDPVSTSIQITARKVSGTAVLVASTATTIA